ncbi:MAG: hypothetical protein JW754_00540 [Candidatus Aenigmarchaeota archaeon]|nr:hypothetical protein [Candidatus Aenigmarchaeota archaeon]
MKHTLKVTLLIVLIFFLAQMVGLVALNYNTLVYEEPETGEVIVHHMDTAIGERPQLEGVSTLVYILIAILIGTGLILLLVRLRKVKIWKAMYFFAVWMTCTITIGVFIGPTISLVLCFILAVLKLYKPNPWTHNITEMFIYAGIAIIFVPLLDIFWSVVLLLAISVYDVIAVWKSGHMVTMAEFQTQSRAFAGVVIGYKEKIKGKFPKAKTKAKPKERTETRNAVLGGGDIAFPMIFAGVVMDGLIRSMGFTKPSAFLMALFIPVVVTIALFILLYKAEKDKFYPAMPFLTAGCLVGYGLMLAVNLLL